MQLIAEKEIKTCNPKSSINTFKENKSHDQNEKPFRIALQVTVPKPVATVQPPLKTLPNGNDNLQHKPMKRTRNDSDSYSLCDNAAKINMHSTQISSPSPEPVDRITKYNLNSLDKTWSSEESNSPNKTKINHLPQEESFRLAVGYIEGEDFKIPFH